MAVCWIGLVASVLLFFNLWPRGMLVVCFVCFLSFVAAAGDFSGYQSDGMLLEAGFIAWFFAPPGFRPGWGETHPPSRASLFLLQWEWFRIYFESGVVKLASGDPQWRNWTAMDQYYQNGPLPTWIGYYVQHLPHWFHASTVFVTFAVELGIVWMMFLPRRWRLVCFFVTTALQIGIILTANYAFLNYLVLSLGILLVDDRFLVRVLPRRWRAEFRHACIRGGDGGPTLGEPEPALSILTVLALRRRPCGRSPARQRPEAGADQRDPELDFLCHHGATDLDSGAGFPLPTSPVAALDPFRIANRYGLFAVMTRGRYEIEFQGSNDGQKWTPYPFRYKPQDPSKARGSTLPTSPGSTGTCGSHRWAIGERIPSCSAPKSDCCRASRCAAVVCRKSFSGCTAKAGARRAVAVLVHHAGGEAAHRHVVAPRPDGVVCSRPGEVAGRQCGGGGVSPADAAAGVRR